MGEPDYGFFEDAPPARHKRTRTKRSARPERADDAGQPEDDYGFFSDDDAGQPEDDYGFFSSDDGAKSKQSATADATPPDEGPAWYESLDELSSAFGQGASLDTADDALSAFGQGESARYLREAADRHPWAHGAGYAVTGTAASLAAPATLAGQALAGAIPAATAAYNRYGDAAHAAMSGLYGAGAGAFGQMTGEVAGAVYGGLRGMRQKLPEWMGGAPRVQPQPATETFDPDILHRGWESMDVEGAPGFDVTKHGAVPRVGVYEETLDKLLQPDLSYPPSVFPPRPPVSTPRSRETVSYPPDMWPEQPAAAPYSAPPASYPPSVFPEQPPGSAPYSAPAPALPPYRLPEQPPPTEIAEGLPFPRARDAQGRLTVPPYQQRMLRRDAPEPVPQAPEPLPIDEPPVTPWSSAPPRPGSNTPLPIDEPPVTPWSHPPPREPAGPLDIDEPMLRRRSASPPGLPTMRDPLPIGEPPPLPRGPVPRAIHRKPTGPTEPIELPPYEPNWQTRPASAQPPPAASDAAMPPPSLARRGLEMGLDAMAVLPGSRLVRTAAAAGRGALRAGELLRQPRPGMPMDLPAPYETQLAMARLGGAAGAVSGAPDAASVPRAHGQDAEAWTPTKLSPSDEAKFQRDLLSGEGYRQWRQEFIRETGVTPDPDSPDNDYDYRGAWKAGIRPEPYEYDGGRYHWASSTPSGKMLKAPDHPTAWMEHFMRRTGEDPGALGLKNEEQGKQYEREKLAYADQATTNYALSEVLHSGQTGLAPDDEAALTQAVVSGDEAAIRAADFRLRQRNPAYARKVERSLRALNEEE